MIKQFENHLFISDCHFGGKDIPNQEELFIVFQQVIKWAITNEYKVNLLGDIFDYWMEFDSGYYPVEFDFILKELRIVEKKQGPILFITGNHDNWTNGFLESQGFDIEENYKLLSIGGQQVLLVHGDGKVQSDWTIKRPFLHRFLRNKPFIKFYKWIQSDRMALKSMIYFSWINRKLRPTKPEEAQKLDNWATQLFTRLPIDVILAGHDHIPRTIRVNDCKYLNLGAFFEDKTFALYNKNGFELVAWDSKNNQPKPYSK
ncbi:hypothetical protein EP331_05240 [bacterium]|nr:MAG: hypothetical protein EP331_05240 [bacterium]